MTRQYKLPLVGLVVVLLSLISVQAVVARSDSVHTVQPLLAGSTARCDVSVLGAPALSTAAEIMDPPPDLDALIASVPGTPDDTESRIPPTGGRFILWTHDGVHVLWGRYGNGFFVGIDDRGVRVWGVYHQHVFTGFYGEQLFWGRYRQGRWIAADLFGLRWAFGEYRLFPYLSPVELTAEIAP